MSHPGNICPAVTTINCTMERGRFPADADPCYLAQKAEIAIRLPEGIVTKTGLLRFLNQMVVSALIRAEERKVEYLWDYKAEVVFAMMDPVPVPILTTKDEEIEKYGTNLRHSLSPFARPSIDNAVKHGVYGMRRPDIILVKDKSRRWPGRGATYFDNTAYSDNLKMLIEMKFPGDTLSKGQRDDYALIATDSRFGVMRITDNRSERQKEYDRAYNRRKRPSARRYVLPPLIDSPDDRPQPVPAPLPVPPPEGEPGTIPQPVYENLPLLSPAPWDYLPTVEDWIVLGKEVSSLIEDGWEYVRDGTREKFRQFGAWVTEKGNWLCEEIIDPITRQASYAIRWVSEKTGEVLTWTLSRLQELWLSVLSGMDMTLEYLQSIDWVQILLDIGDGTVQLLIKVRDELVTNIVGLAVAAALIILVAALVAAASVGSAAVGAVCGALALMGGGTLAAAQ
ncbi:VRR-NUC domain-containing protein [Entomohabitans teleogrylli]|uniref:VRR-NUC domain-containing protein n=1 Tax=Entomohabitans teleogrylli TaxID=1384589 RepID=UPI00073D63ED|nr:VRR-NUC domain-containing protein [Entomohabitans teleogrylli]